MRKQIAFQIMLMLPIEIISLEDCRKKILSTTISKEKNNKHKTQLYNDLTILIFGMY